MKMFKQCCCMEGSTGAALEGVVLQDQQCLGNNFRNTKFGYSCSETGTTKGRSNWSGFLILGREKEVEGWWKKKMK